MSITTQQKFRELLAKALANDAIAWDPPALDYIDAILVQQHEVVATCYASDKFSVIAALSNPDFSENLDTSKHNVQIQPKGENLWTKVQGSSQWYCAFM
jgi:hypothetical protein